MTKQQTYRRRRIMYRLFGKRLPDLALALPALILLAPLFALLALLVRLRLGSPILFRQVRPGLRGKPFTIVWGGRFARDVWYVDNYLAGLI